MVETRVALAFVVTLGFASVVNAQTTPLLTAGMPYAAKIDTDTTGGPSANDCTFTPKIDTADGDISVAAAQTGGLLLKACAIGPYTGSAVLDASGNFFKLKIDQPAASGQDIPLSATATDPSNPGGRPLATTRLDIAAGLGSGLLCEVGGEPGIAARSSMGTFIVGALSFFPNDMNPTHIKIPALVMGMPFLCLQGKFGGRFCLDGYIPINMDRTIDVAPEGDDPSVLINLDELATCPTGRNAAPTTTEWGVIGLIVALLVVGTWAIGRRPSFAHSLPRP